MTAGLSVCVAGLVLTDAAEVQSRRPRRIHPYRVTAGRQQGAARVQSARSRPSEKAESLPVCHNIPDRVSEG